MHDYSNSENSNSNIQGSTSQCNPDKTIKMANTTTMTSADEIRLLSLLLHKYGNTPTTTVPPLDTIACCFPGCLDTLQNNQPDVNIAHYQNHLGDHEQLFCPKCYQGFPSKKQIEDHFLVHHAKMSKTCCEHCPRAFWLKRQLKLHISNVHPSSDVKLNR